jgi:D-lactate dehydrogenase (cytochrome)
MYSARQRAVAELCREFGAMISINASTREQHGRGEANATLHAPDAVAFPESTDDVARMVRICARYGVPVIPFGAGTSLEGQVSAPYGGLTLDLSRMDAVLRVSAEDSDCVVQPGVTREALNQYLRDTGLFFPVDPGANASIGGMVSTRASGTTTIRYGTIAHNVLALEVVTGQGEVIRVGTRARKSSAGYDLVRLLTGAEGTLGVITEITLRLHPQPEATASAVCAFPALASAVQAVTEIIQSGSAVARIEFLDALQVRACNRHSSLALAELPTLFIEFHGTRSAVEEQLALARGIVESHGASHFQTATDAAQRAALWKARHQAYFAARALRPGAECIIADVAVPMSALAEAVTAARAGLDAAGLLGTIVGHVGDGNFHVLFLFDPAAADERAKVDAVYDAMIAHAHSVGGTCTGEHGIGLGKRGKLVEEFGTTTVGLMQAIKRAWDPAGILNPGKIFLD